MFSLETYIPHTQVWFTVQLLAEQFKLKEFMALIYFNADSISGTKLSRISDFVRIHDNNNGF